MKRLIYMLLLIQSGFIMAQTETVAGINGKKVIFMPISSVNNGLTLTAGNIQLGGVLTKPSVLATSSSNTLAITGLMLGGVSDNVLVVDSNGVLKYVSRLSLDSGDNLGNHIATQNLDMSSKNILNIYNAYVKNELQILDRVGTNSNHFGFYKNNGFFGIWNNLKGANALTIDETTSKTTLTSAQIAKGTDGSIPAIGSIAVSADGVGNVKWVAPASIGAGDNLGNHTATTDLLMSGKNISNAANITASGKTSTQTAQIVKGIDNSIPALGSIAVSADGAGNVKWVAPANIGAGDNLGNHTATTDLLMSGKNISNAANITASGKTSTQKAQISFGADDLPPIVGAVATSADTNGNIVWKAPKDFGTTLYTSTVVASGASYVFTLLDNPMYSNLVLTSGDGCGIPMIANFMSYSNGLAFVGGSGSGNPYSSTSLSMYGNSYKLTVTSTGCQDGGDSTQFNFSINKSGSQITITNNGNKSRQYELRQKVN